MSSSCGLSDENASHNLWSCERTGLWLHNLILKGLGYRKLCAKWVPWVEVCLKWISCYGDYSSTSLSRTYLCIEREFLYKHVEFKLSILDNKKKLCQLFYCYRCNHRILHFKFSSGKDKFVYYFSPIDIFTYSYFLSYFILIVFSSYFCFHFKKEKLNYWIFFRLG